MNPQVFEAHGGLQTPYPHSMPDNKPALTVVSMWRDINEMLTLYNSIDWNYCSKLILLVRADTPVNLPGPPHPNIDIIGIGDATNITELIQVLIDNKKINTEYYYLTTKNVVPAGLWETLRSGLTDGTENDFIWLTGEGPFKKGLRLNHNTPKRSNIQTLTVNTTGTFTELCKLAARYQTDKSTYNLFTHRHPYTPVYSMFLGNLRAQDKPHIAEIGVLNGASIRMWRDYFRNPEIYAFDINEKLLEPISSIARVGRIDSGDPAQIADTFGKLPALDLILEDASHRLEHQVTAVRELVKYLKVGGLLVVEDIFRCVPNSYFQEAIDACGYEVEAYMVLPEDKLRASPQWENDRVLIVRRLA
jgi:hypothetical protein